MKIVDVRTTVLRLPTVKPIADGIQDVLIIEVLTDEGIVGIGEVQTSPMVAQTVIEAPVSHVCSRGLKSIIVGRDPLERELLWEDMYRFTSVYGRRGVVIHAISGIDMALWDIAGKKAGFSVSQLLGGKSSKKILAYASILMPSTVVGVREQVQKVLEKGFRAIKLGWGPFEGDLTKCVELVKAARKEAGRDVDIMVDVGFGHNIVQAIRFAHEMEKVGVFFLEEPLSPDNLVGYAKLTSRVEIPIAAGERVERLEGFIELLDHGVSIVQPDVSRAGGITECKKIVDFVNRRECLCIPHCWSTDILLSATLHLASCISDIPYIEFCIVDTPLRTNAVAEPIKVVDGMVQVPRGPGLGVELDREVLEHFAWKG